MLILKVKNLTASKFADEIGVQRSSISHLFSGRNQPSLDLIQKILKKYPDISTDWLVSGTGSMLKEAQMDLFAQETHNLKQEHIDLFTANETVNTLQNADYNPVQPQIHTPNPTNNSIIQEENKTHTILSNSEHIKIEKNENQHLNSSIEENNNKINSTDQNKSKTDEKKSVEKIVIFYDNKTYREYYQE